MAIPIYNIDTLPTITFPMKNTHVSTKKYLGGRAVTGEVEININLIANSNIELKALYDFWLTDCNYGLEPFVIPLPLFGSEPSLTNPTLLVKFISDIETEKVSSIWRANLKLEVFGTLDYIINDLGEFVVTDNGEYTLGDGGEYVPTGNVINSYREVFYG